MKKQIVAAAAFATCLALCAAVWPQSEPIEETPASPLSVAVTAAHPEVPEMPKIEEVIIPEKEKVNVVEPEQTETAAPPPGTTQTSTPPEKKKRQSKSMNQKRNRQHRTPLRTTWSMCQASAGWKAKVPITSNMPKICMRTVIKSEAWDKRIAVRY